MERLGWLRLGGHERLSIRIGRFVSAALGVLAVLTLSAHLGLQSYYADRVLPGVSVAGVALGGLTMDQARAKLSRVVRAYKANIVAGDKTFTATADQLGVTYDLESSLAEAYGARRAAIMPVGRIALPLNYVLHATTLRAYATGIAAQVGRQPQDATVAIKGLAAEPVSDASGWSVSSAELVTRLAQDAARPSGKAISFHLSEQPAKIKLADVAPVLEDAKTRMALPLFVTYGDRSFSPTAAQIGSWLTFTKQSTDQVTKLVVGVDQSRVKGYVQQIANSVNVAPTDKKLLIQDGVSRVTQDGVDGLAIDQDPLVAVLSDAVTSGQTMTVVATTHVVPFKTLSTSLVSLDIDRYIEVNLSKQHLWVWQDKNVIYDTPITSGATGAGFPTVTGLFSIYYKTTDTHLVGTQYGPRYNYDVHVNYWMPFYSGYGLHDASWRNGNFGGSDYYYGGSHGCVNLPDAAAAFIYGWSTVGTPVWVHN